MKIRQISVLNRIMFSLAQVASPAVLEKMLVDPDQKKRERVFDAFMNMKKFNIEELPQAYQG